MSFISAMRSEDEAVDETVEVNDGSHSIVPREMASNSHSARDHSPVLHPSSTGRRRSARRSFLGQLGLVEAQKVDDAEPVFYASVVNNNHNKARRSYVFGEGALMIGLTLAFALGLTMRNRETSCQLDKRCCVDFTQLPMAPDTVSLLCYCNQSLDLCTSKLTDANITFANLLRDRLVFLNAFPILTSRMIPSDDPSERCLVYDQMYWAGAQMDVESLGTNKKAGSILLLPVCTMGWMDCIFIDTMAGLKLSGNDFKIPSQLGKMNILRELDLSHNHHVTGTIPADLSDSTALVSIGLSNLPLSSPVIPSTLGSLRCLESLELSDSDLIGTILPEIFNAQTLRTLDASNNNLNGSISSSVGNATNLHVLNLSNNFLSGTLLSEIALLSHLNILELANNDFKGQLPSFLSAMPLLELVSIWDSGFTGDIPPDFCDTDLNREIVVTCSTSNITRLQRVRCVEDYPQVIRNEL